MLLMYMSPSSQPWYSTINWLIVAIVGMLTAVGLGMMVSAGGGNMELYFYPQLMKVCAGLVLAVIITFFPFPLLFRYAYVFYALALLALIVVEITGHMGMGAQRWIRIGGFTLQPSEFMKIALILAFARYFHMLHADDHKRFLPWFWPMLLLAIPALLILRQPNLGTTIILCGTAAIMMFVAGFRWRYIAVLVAILLLSLPVAWEMLHDYQKQRVLTFLNPEKDPLGSGYNILQSIIAIGSGGLFGKGFLQGSQGQLDFLPEKHTDFIFTMLAEEWGFTGSIFILFLFGALFATALNTAYFSQSRFGALIIIGVVGVFFQHVFINCAMVMALIPVVGVPLPFLSYGGSIMLTVMAGVGLLLNVYRNRHNRLLSHSLLN